MKIKFVVFGGVIVGAAVATMWSFKWPAYATDSDGDGRDQTATWMTDVAPGYVLVVATSSNVVDWRMDVEMVDSTNKQVWEKQVVHSGSVGLASGGVGTTVTFKDYLGSYSSPANFTITAKYYNRRGRLVDTESISFSKP